MSLCVFVFVFVFLLREWEVGRRQVVAGGSINTLPRMAHFSPSMPSPNTATLVNTKEQPCNCLGATSDAVEHALPAGIEENYSTPSSLSNNKQGYQYHSIMYF